MKTLLLLRHAKSSWKDPSLSDFDRPLTKRGKRIAERMGNEISRHQLTLDLVLSSAARRARQTAKRAVQAAGYSGTVVKKKKLYLTGVRRHLQVLAEVDDAYNCVLLIGHNPDLEDVVERLTGDAVSMPTGALVGIELVSDSWTAMPGAFAKLLFVVTSKDLTPL